MIFKNLHIQIGNYQHLQSRFWVDISSKEGGKGGNEGKKERKKGSALGNLLQPPTDFQISWRNHPPRIDRNRKRQEKGVKKKVIDDEIPKKGAETRGVSNKGTNGEPFLSYLFPF
jgi:hypothetical protein